MTSIKLAGLFVITTLYIHQTKVRGEMFILQNEDKEQPLKVTEKRVDNFRVPVETPFDPNFWPARGRRGEGDAFRKHQNNCACSDENFVYEKEKTIENCYDLQGKANPTKALEDCVRKFNLRIPNLIDSGLVYQSVKGTEGSRHKKQKYANAPDIMWLYGDGVYWELNDPYSEKEKKQDVFWVARGKKGFKVNFNIP